MKNIQVFLFCMIFVQVGLSENLPNVNELLSTVNWETGDQLCKEKVYMADNYLGISTPLYPSPKSDIVITYKHFSKAGDLIWSTSDIDYEFHSVNVSQSGNRILIQREPAISSGESKRITEVYNEDGDHLFTSPLQGYFFYSSPNGEYYYSVPKYRSPNEILFLDRNGNYLYDSGIKGGVDSRFYAINDSTLLIYQYNVLTLFDVKLNVVLKNKEMPAGRDYPYFKYSSQSNSSIAWSSNSLVLYDSLLQEITSIQYEYELISVDAELNSIGAVLYNKNASHKTGLICQINNLDGSMVLSKNIQFSPNDRYAQPYDLYYDSEYFIHIYKSTISNNQNCSVHGAVLFIIDKEAKVAKQYKPDQAWLFRDLNNDQIIEIGNNYIKSAQH